MFPAQFLLHGTDARGLMAFEREDVFVDRVEHVGGLGEEGLFQFVGGRDPVAGADDGPKWGQVNQFRLCLVSHRWRKLPHQTENVKSDIVAVRQPSHPQVFPSYGLEFGLSAGGHAARSSKDRRMPRAMT